MGQSASSISCASARDRTEEENDEPERLLALLEGQPLVTQPPLNDCTSWLPNECLAFIFQKLCTADRNRCSLVCKRWLSVEAQGRKRLSLRAEDRIVACLPAIFARFDHVTKLALRADSKINSICDRALFLVGRHCINLSKLKIKGCKQITDDGVEQFARIRGFSLQKLSCASCNFGARGINAIVAYCSSLEDLAVKRLRGLADGPPELIGPGCGTIRRLSLKKLMNAQLFGPLIAGSRNLHTLRICWNSGNWDKLLEIITVHVPNLVELHMESLHVSDRGLLAVSRCIHLEVLHIVKIPECTNHGLSAIAEGCKQLKKLHIDGGKFSRICDDGLVALAMKCRDLQEVVLIGVNATTTSLGLMAANCSGLERLALCNSTSVGDPELSCIADKCLSLKRLCVKGCAISDQGMRMLSTGCPRLVKAKIKKCSRVTWQSAVWLHAHRPSLVLSLDAEAPDDDIPDISRVAEEGFAEPVSAALPPSLQPRSPFARVKLALAAGGSFVACTLLRWSSSKGS